MFPNYKSESFTNLGIGQVNYTNTGCSGVHLQEARNGQSF